MQNVLELPKSFWWGTSLSSHQAEGGNINTWTRWEQRPGKIKNNETSGLACRHWDLYEEDFKWLTWLNADTHRFSVEWSRLEPEPGQWNEEAAKHYRKMILSLKSKGIRPILCFFHFSLPLWVDDRGGFENHETVERFFNFALKCFSAFGDLVQDWLTINEPVVYALAAYGAGLTPPGKKDLKAALKVIAHLYESHGKIYYAIKSRDSLHSVSLAHHMRCLTPKRPFWLWDYLVCRKGDQLFNWSLIEAFQKGHFEVYVPGLVNAKFRIPEAQGALDYLGINYYGRDHLGYNLFSKDPIVLDQTPKNLRVKTDMGWEIYPQGLTQILEGLKKRDFNLPILMTENGIADAEDRMRETFIYDHLSAFLLESKRLGLKAKGYLHWSLLDNFEWIDGFYPRFGLIGIDYETQKRIPRKSAFYFRGIGSSRKLSVPLGYNP